MTPASAGASSPTASSGPRHGLEPSQGVQKEKTVGRNLEKLMNPRSVGVVGASPKGNRGTRVVDNLLQAGFEGRIIPIHPRYEEVRGLACFPSVEHLPSPVDSLVVAIPAAGVPEVLRQAWDTGIEAVTVLASGFGEAGAAGRERHGTLRDLASRGMVICGPNCYGIYNVATGAAAFSGRIETGIRRGGIAMVSQSGGLSAALPKHMTRQRAAGFSYLVSCGNQVGVGLEDYFAYLVDDPDTTVICAFVEGFREPRRLLEISRAARAAGKPIVLMKVGRSEQAQRATLAHTGTLAGRAEIADALFEQCGFLQVHSLNELFENAHVLEAAATRRLGPRLALLSGSGGEAGHVSDVAEAVGLDLPAFSAETQARLRAALPEFATVQNPLDGTGALYDDVTVFPRLADALGDDDATDVLAITLGWEGRPRFAEALKRTAGETDRLIVAYSSFIGGPVDVEAVTSLRASGIPFVEGTEVALSAIRNAVRFFDVAGGVIEPAGDLRPLDLRLVEAFSADGTGLVPFPRAAALLADYDIPVAETVAAATAQDAVAAAQRLGFPVAVKVDSDDVVHKTDVGGVRLHCRSARDVRAAYDAILAEVAARRPQARVNGVLVQRMAGSGIEMIVGVTRDELFGPVVVVGLGGLLVEVLGDTAIRVPPITRDDAAAMLAQLQGRQLFSGVRGQPATDTGPLKDLLVRVGDFAAAAGEGLVALDLNPVVVAPVTGEVVALDIVLQTAERRKQVDTP